MKINLISTNFKHHYDGWNAAVRKLKTLHNPYGIYFYDWADKLFKENTLLQFPWSGFLHNVVEYPVEHPEKYFGKILSLNKLITQDIFIKNLKYCKGLFTLCEYTANFLKQHIETPVHSLHHPIVNVKENFDFKLFLNNPKIYLLGQWLRKYQSFFNLKSFFPKFMIKISDDYIKNTSEIKFINYVNNMEYDAILKSSIVYLDLHDVAACNTLLECIIRNTPVLTTRLPASEEYLGHNYPLFFSTPEEANSKINNLDLILQSHIYLKNLNKNKLSPDFFLDEFKKSKIYQEFPIVKI